MNSTTTFKKKPLNILLNALLDISYHCGHIYKNLTNNQTKTWIFAQYEFLYFFTYLAMHYASLILGREREEHLKEVLYPLLKDKTTKNWLSGIPEEIRMEIINTFLDRMESAEKNYSNCKDIFPGESDCPDDCLFTRLAKNIAELPGYGKDLKAIAVSVGYSTDLFNHTNLDEYIEPLKDTDFTEIESRN